MTAPGTQIDPAPPTPLGRDIVSEWMLDPEIAFLNHGCFGARPRTVSTAQQNWRDRIEVTPIELLDRQRKSLIDEAKDAVGAAMGMAPDDFGFITNATGGVNAVLRSLKFEAGDELLTFDHVYNAVRMTMKYLADHVGVAYREIPLPLPVPDSQVIMDALEASITPRTKLLVIDHITSPTALLFPIREIVAHCEARGIDVLIDGAHAPGMIDLNVEQLGAAYYTGNLHKWFCAPMGTAFLWVRPDRQAGIHPTTISHFLDQGLANEFEWQGTRDISGWLAAPEALRYFETYGLERVRQHNHDMAVWVQRLICERWGTTPNSPVDGSMLGSMVTLTLPVELRDRWDEPMALQRALYERHRIEAPIIGWSDRWWTRASCQMYNTPEQYVKLANAILELAR